MDPKEQLVRDLYAARARRGWAAVRALLAAGVVWHERIADGESAEAWFSPDGFDPTALTAVVSP